MEDRAPGLSVIIDLSRQASSLARPRAAAAALLHDHGYVEIVPHLTLAIVREQGSMEPIRHRLGKLARFTAPFPLELTGEIAILPCRLPACEMALVLLVDKSPELIRLYRRVRRSLWPLREHAHHAVHRRWLPHIALAYLAGIPESEAGGLAGELERVASAVQLEADNIELTRLDPSGRWLKVQAFPFLDNNPT